MSRQHRRVRHCGESDGESISHWVAPRGEEVLTRAPQGGSSCSPPRRGGRDLPQSLSRRPGARRSPVSLRAREGRGARGQAGPDRRANRADADVRAARGPALDLGVLPYSSGTTGFPKGVMLTHRNLVANLVQPAPVFHITEQDRIVAVLPFFHIYGMQVVLNLSLWHGATLVTLPKFELEPFLGLLQQYRITRAFAVPPLALPLAKHPAVDGYDLSSLRFMSSGAAPLDAALETACTRRLGCGVTQGYGLTEASPVTHATSAEPGKAKPGTIGTLLPTTDCRIGDPG